MLKNNTKGTVLSGASPEKNCVCKDRENIVRAFIWLYFKEKGNYAKLAAGIALARINALCYTVGKEREIQRIYPLTEPSTRMRYGVEPAVIL